MKLIVGLGNPGRKYQGTRHNVGFDVLDLVARSVGAAERKTKFNGDVAEATRGQTRVLLLWPQTFMNLSGTSVGKACDFYKLASQDVLIICDDFNLTLGRLRFRAQGSAGGQKGLEDIIRRLGTDQINRLRIGVGPLPDGWDTAAFVTGKFKPHEGETIENAVALAAQAVSDWTERGIDYCMNRYNEARQL